jgi:hypothetical protein
VVRLLGIPPRSLAELLALAMPAGAIAFVLGLFVAGFLGLLRPWFAVLWPFGLALLALWSERNHLTKVRAWLARHRLRPAALGPFRLVATGLGLLAVVLAYLQSLSPAAMTYDAAWTHLSIAQDYAREGRIVPFLADWPKTLPHLGSVLNTWSFLVPGLDQPAEKWMMALHTEFVFFLWTLVSVAAVMIRLGGYRPGAWAAVFLFPAFFVYDHCLGGGADHFLAFWSTPILLALYETVATRALRWWLMLAVVLSGAILTKSQAVMLVVPATAILLVVLLRDTLRHLLKPRSPGWRRIWLPPAAAVAATLALTAPHFGANLVYHGNPLYPFAQDVFTGSRPTVPDAAVFADYLLRSSGSHPPSTLVDQAKSLAVAVLTFPCHPHVPESGALFAVALVLALLLPRARALRFALLFAVSTLVVWNLTYPQGRNLQGVLPVVAVVTGAVLVRALALGRLARFGVVLLLLFQVIAGLDAFFATPDRLASAVSLIRSSHDGRADKRFADFQRDYLELGASLPKKAVVLMHTMHTNLGINRPILHDGFGFQSLIDPRTLRTARALYLRLREVGVTHIVYEPHGSAAVTRQGEVVFDAFAARYQGSGRSFGGMRVFAMPSAPPPEEPDYEVLVVRIHEQDDGLYDVADLGTVEDLPREMRARKPPKVPFSEANALALLSRARVVLRGRDAQLPPTVTEALSARFDEYVSYSDFSVFIRKP